MLPLNETKLYQLVSWNYKILSSFSAKRWTVFLLQTDILFISYQELHPYRIFKNSVLYILTNFSVNVVWIWRFWLSHVKIYFVFYNLPNFWNNSHMFYVNILKTIYGIQSKLESKLFPGTVLLFFFRLVVIQKKIMIVLFFSIFFYFLFSLIYFDFLSVSCKWRMFSLKLRVLETNNIQLYCILLLL